jgi:CHAT domain
MPGRTYTDFVLDTQILNWGNSGGERIFSVRVLDSPAGQQVEPEPVVIRDYDELDNQVWALEDPQRDVTLAQQRELGTCLADLLLPATARTFLLRSQKRLRSPEEGLRLRLRLDPRLASLPWELMCIGDGGRSPGFLALDPQLSIVRHEVLPIPVDWPTPSKTLRIVVAMASPLGNTRLDALPGEQRAIKQALSSVRGVDPDYKPDYGEQEIRGPIPSASLADLRAALKAKPRTDVFQFSGHGKFVPRSGRELGTERGKGFIFLEGKAGSEQVTADQLARLVHDKCVRLIYLDACETAASRPYEGAESFAVELLEHELPCVLAMQFAVNDQLAALFTMAFYQALVAGWTVDEAVSQGRAAVYARGQRGRYAVRDWGAPVLYSRIPGGDLFRPVLDEQARQEAERLAEQRARLSQAWWGWASGDDTLATRGQLDNLEEAAAEVELAPFQLLFLLRSSAKAWVPGTPWLERLRHQGGKWVTDLDDPHTGEVDEMPEVRPILGLDQPPAARPEGVGRLAWSAVAHPDQLTRQTAALALASLEAQDGLRRLDGAVRAVKGLPARWAARAPAWLRRVDRTLGPVKAPGQRWWRRAELRGTLVELDPGHTADYTGSLPPPGRISLWLWRFWRRFLCDLGRILSLTLGAGLGAALTLGAVRLWLAIAAGPFEGPLFAGNLTGGLFLGAATALGMALAGPLLVGRPSQAGRAGPGRRGLLDFARQPAVLAVLLGALFFGTAHLPVRWFNGIAPLDQTLLILAGYLAGLGVSLGLYALPRAGLRLGPAGWLLRLGTAAGIWVLVQLAFGNSSRSATAVNYVADVYTRVLFQHRPALQAWVGRFSNTVTLLDAALAGVLLLVGTAAGLQIAAGLYARWSAAVHRD